MSVGEPLNSPCIPLLPRTHSSTSSPTKGRWPRAIKMHLCTSAPFPTSVCGVMDGVAIADARKMALWPNTTMPDAALRCMHRCVAVHEGSTGRQERQGGDYGVGLIGGLARLETFDADHKAVGEAKWMAYFMLCTVESPLDWIRIIGYLRYGELEEV